MNHALLPKVKDAQLPAKYEAARFEIPLRCRIDGVEKMILIEEADAEALRARLDKVRVPIVGYRELSKKLGQEGIKMSTQALANMVNRRRLPCRRFGRKVTFYLPEVLERIGGKS